MDESAEEPLGFEEIAHLSLWTSFRYFIQIQEALIKDVKRCQDECIKAKVSAGQDLPLQKRMLN